MDEKIIDGVILSNLKVISNPKGNIYKGLTNNDIGFNGFGEIYFTSIKYNEIKGWKKHTEMTMNIIVVSGSVSFSLYDDRPGSSTKGERSTICLSVKDRYKRLTVPPGIWVSFKGLEENFNLLMNFADIVHDPNESVNCSLSDFHEDI